MQRIALWTFLLPVLLSPLACSGGGGGGAAPRTTTEATPAAAATITGPPGTALEGLVLSIPAGAVTAPVTVSVEVGSAGATNGQAIAGPAAKFGPEGLTFAVPATLDLPYDPGAVTGGLLGGLRVQLRDDRSGAVTELLPDDVDPVAGTVQVQISHFSTCWVTFPIPTGGFDAVGTLALGGPDTAVLGTTLKIGDLGFLVPGVYTFLDEFTEFPGPPGNLDYIVVMNIFEAPGASLSMTIAVDGVDYGYICTNVNGSSYPCGNLTIDPIAQSVTFDDVVAEPAGENATAPLLLNGVIQWTGN
ncbi:MAG: hypothetical protein KDE27_01820 [Planctomycetes bacterium]|nr:hypothetical protein [Planctomycetota bacterium]